MKMKPVEDKFWVARVGEQVKWLPDDYIGPPGMVAIIELDEVPPNLLIFIKNFVIVGIWDRSDPDSIDTATRPECDAVLHHTGEGPEQTMGRAWVDAAIAKVHKSFH